MNLRSSILMHYFFKKIDDIRLSEKMTSTDFLKDLASLGRTFSFKSTDPPISYAVRRLHFRAFLLLSVFPPYSLIPHQCTTQNYDILLLRLNKRGIFLYSKSRGLK